MKSPFGKSETQTCSDAIAGGGKSQPDVTGSPGPSQASRLARLSEVFDSARFQSSTYYWSAVVLGGMQVLVAALIVRPDASAFITLINWLCIVGITIFILKILTLFRDRYNESLIVIRERETLVADLQRERAARGKAGNADAERTPNGTSASANRHSNVTRLNRPRDLSIVRGDDGNGAA